MTYIFKPSKAEVWTRFAKEMGGEYKHGDPLGKDTLKWTYKKWIIIMDTIQRNAQGKNVYTRIRVSFLHKKKLRFSISPKNYLSKLLNMQGVIIGNESFEKEFIVKSNDVDQIKRMMKSTELVRVIRNLAYVNLKVVIGRNGWFGLCYPPKISVLELKYPGEVLEITILRDFTKLFCVLLDRLIEINVAYEKNPNFAL